jgi:hypothetical protein
MCEYRLSPLILEQLLGLAARRPSDGENLGLSFGARGSGRGMQSILGELDKEKENVCEIKLVSTVIFRHSVVHDTAKPRTATNVQCARSRSRCGEGQHNRLCGNTGRTNIRNTTLTIFTPPSRNSMYITISSSRTFRIFTCLWHFPMLHPLMCLPSWKKYVT